MNPRPLLLPFALFVVALLPACSSEAPAATGQPKTAHTIRGVDNSWEPAGIVVPVGEEVRLTIENEDRGVAHNFHLHAPKGPKTKIEIGPGTQRTRFVLDEAGSYTFVCDVHPQMRGTVKAVAAS